MDVRDVGFECSPTLPCPEKASQRNGRSLPLMRNYDAVRWVRLAGGGGGVGSQHGGETGVFPALEAGSHVIDLLVPELIQSFIRILRYRTRFGRAVNDDALITRRKQPSRADLRSEERRVGQESSGTCC